MFNTLFGSREYVSEIVDSSDWISDWATGYLCPGCENILNYEENTVGRNKESRQDSVCENCGKEGLFKRVVARHGGVTVQVQHPLFSHSNGQCTSHWWEIRSKNGKIRRFKEETHPVSL